MLLVPSVVVTFCIFALVWQRVYCRYISCVSQRATPAWNSCSVFERTPWGPAFTCSWKELRISSWTFQLVQLNRGPFLFGRHVNTMLRNSVNAWPFIWVEFTFFVQKVSESFVPGLHTEQSGYGKTKCVIGNFAIWDLAPTLLPAATLSDEEIWKSVTKQRCAIYHVVEFLYLNHWQIPGIWEVTRICVICSTNTDACTVYNSFHVQYIWAVTSVSRPPTTFRHLYITQEILRARLVRSYPIYATFVIGWYIEIPLLGTALPPHARTKLVILNQSICPTTLFQGDDDRCTLRCSSFDA